MMDKSVSWVVRYPVMGRDLEKGVRGLPTFKRWDESESLNNFSTMVRN